MAAHLSRHGDGVKDVSFLVDDVDSIFKRAVEKGAAAVREPYDETSDEGSVRFATVKTFGDTTHTFIDKSRFKGFYLPGFSPATIQDPLASMLREPGLRFFDHVVGNLAQNELYDTAQWYENTLAFHRFWSVDEKDICTEYSSLRSVVMANAGETIKLPLNEPVPKKRKSQIQEFIDYYGGAGIQHIAMRTHDIIETITVLRARGQEFIRVPKNYYSMLRERLKTAKIVVEEDLDTLERLDILIDYDDNGYLLQTFSKNLQDRPTVFLEVIQRHNHSGFGAGNFKSLYEAIEADQKERGNL